MCFEFRDIDCKELLFRGFEPGLRNCSLYSGNSPVGNVEDGVLTYKSEGMQRMHHPILLRLAQEFNLGLGKSEESVFGADEFELVSEFSVRMAEYVHRVKSAAKPLRDLAKKEGKDLYVLDGVFALDESGELVACKGFASVDGDCAEQYSYYFRERALVNNIFDVGDILDRIKMVWVVRTMRTYNTIWMKRGIRGVVKFGPDVEFDAEEQINVIKD